MAELGSARTITAPPAPDTVRHAAFRHILQFANLAIHLDTPASVESDPIQVDKRPWVAFLTCAASGSVSALTKSVGPLHCCISVSSRMPARSSRSMSRCSSSAIDARLPRGRVVERKEALPQDPFHRRIGGPDRDLPAIEDDGEPLVPAQRRAARRVTEYHVGFACAGKAKSAGGRPRSRW